MNYLKRIALKLHIQYNKLYSYYKLRDAKLVMRFPLNSHERSFYLKLRIALQGDALIVYDIGAAKGTVCCLLAKLPNVSEIHAFEPIPEIHKKLVLSTQSYSNVHCHNVALGNENDEKNMYVASNSDSSSLLQMEKLHREEFAHINTSSKLVVRCVRLDDYVRANNLAFPHVVKIDVQGYEKNVLDGGKEVIKQADYCILEMSFYPLYENSPLFDDIYTQMKELGFYLIALSDPLRGKSGEQLQVDGIFKKHKPIE